MSMNRRVYYARAAFARIAPPIGAVKYFYAL